MESSSSFLSFTGAKISPLEHRVERGHVAMASRGMWMSCEQSCLGSTCCSLKPEIPAGEMHFWVAVAGREISVARNSHREDEVRWLSVQVS